MTVAEEKIVRDLADRGWRVQGPRHRDGLYRAVARDRRGGLAIYAPSLPELLRRIGEYERRAA